MKHINDFKVLETSQLDSHFESSIKRQQKYHNIEYSPDEPLNTSRDNAHLEINYEMDELNLEIEQLCQQIKENN